MRTYGRRGEHVSTCIEGATNRLHRGRKKYLFTLQLITAAIFLVLSGTVKAYAHNNLPEIYYGEKISLAYSSVKKLVPPPFADTLGSDLLIPVQKPRLLPKRISFMEKYLWGENGMVRKMGIVPALSSKERIHELHIRRTMLTAHQIGGFTTLALMLSAAYFGQQVIDGHRHMGDIHQALVTATMISYSITGLLAILSPPPLIRRDEGGTVVIHKTLAWIHFAGMIITPILGSMIGGRRHFNINKAHFHQIAGYITTAVFTASMLVITF